MRRLVCFVIVLIVLTPTLASAEVVSVVRVSSPSPFPIGDCQPDDRALFDEGAGSEASPRIAVNPRNRANIVAAWASDTAYGVVAASSFDGGATWRRTVVPGLSKCTGGTENHAGPPGIAFGPDGKLYMSVNTFHGPFPTPGGFIGHIGSVTSDDGGLTWSAPVWIDKLPIGIRPAGMTAERDVPGAAVTAWYAPVPIAASLLSRTTDGGRTWKTYQLPNPYPQFATYMTPLATRDGRLYVFIVNEPGPKAVTQELDAAGMPVPAKLFVTHSDDKGKTWTAPRQLLDGVRTDSPGAVERRDGALFVSAWRGTDAEPKELIVLRSSDDGATWSQPSVIARDVISGFPKMAVDGGTLGVTYAVPDASGARAVFARSTDDGRSWTTEPVAGPFAAMRGVETVGRGRRFASVFIRQGPDTDGPTDVYVARIK